MISPRQLTIWPIIEDSGNYLYLSCSETAESFQVLHSRNIMTLIGFEKVRQFPNRSYILLEQEDFNQILEESGREIEEGLKIGSVLVHCHNAVSNSPAVIIGYLMKFRKMRYEKAFYFMKEKRNVIHPSLILKRALMRYQDQLNEVSMSGLKTEVNYFSEKIKDLQLNTYTESPKVQSSQNSQSYIDCKTPAFLNCSPKNFQKSRFSRRGSIKVTLRSQSAKKNELSFSVQDEDEDPDINTFNELDSPQFPELQVRLRHRRKIRQRRNRSTEKIDN